MRRLKEACYLGLAGIVVLTTLALMGCTADSGIKQPLLDPLTPSVTPTEEGLFDYPVIRGNYFLLDSDCPNDSTALRVAQEQDGILIEGGFTFEDPDAVLVGWVDETFMVRFFGTNDAADANCTAQVESDIFRGVCTYEDGIEIKECRYVYSMDVAGIYSEVWNDCPSDGQSLTVDQSGTSVTLTGGFDFEQNVLQDSYDGVVQEGKVLWDVSINDNFNPAEHNCQFIVSGSDLQGSCINVAANPATVCTFGYSNPGRIAGVDLTDDSQFPSPAINPGINPGIFTDMEGVYTLVSNDCDHDGGSIEIAQSGVSLGFIGGFDYQAPDPDIYAGSMVTNVEFAFSVLGAVEKAFCTADVLLNGQGIAGFTGTCNLQQALTSCDFAYSKVQ